MDTNGKKTKRNDMKNIRIAICSFLIILITGCGTQTLVTSNGASVHVHQQNSNMVANCKAIGPVNFQHSPAPVVAITSTPKEDTINRAREITAQMGGDSLVIVDMQSEYSQALWNFHGIALNCFNKK